MKYEDNLEDSLYEKLGLKEFFLKDSFLEPKINSFEDFDQEPEIDFENLEIKSIALIPRFRDEDEEVKKPFQNQQKD